MLHVKPCQLIWKNIPWMNRLVKSESCIVSRAERIITSLALRPAVVDCHIVFQTLFNCLNCLCVRVSLVLIARGSVVLLFMSKQTLFGNTHHMKVTNKNDDLVQELHTHLWMSTSAYSCVLGLLLRCVMTKPICNLLC